MKKEYVQPVCNVMICETTSLLAGSNEYSNNQGKIGYDPSQTVDAEDAD